MQQKKELLPEKKQKGLFCREMVVEWNMPLDLADTLSVKCEAKLESNKFSLCSSLWRKI